MKANVKSMIETKRNVSSYRKENGFDSEIAAIDPKTGQTIVTARFYFPGSVAYCVLWVHGDSAFGMGCGKAGGYGYHKTSAALADAIADAGIDLSEHIGGRGESVMKPAVEAIARAVTSKRKFILHKANA